MRSVRPVELSAASQNAATAVRESVDSDCRGAGELGGSVAAIRSRAARPERGTALIPLTVSEVRKLLLRLVWDRVPEAEQVLAWSRWRREHQHRALRGH
jgi:hypothetical protein